MNHWKTTESVTNQAEIIHFGGNVYLELHSLTGSHSVISGSICMGGKEPKHEVPTELKTSSAILSSAVNTKGMGGVGWGRAGKMWGGEEHRQVILPLSLAFQCTNLILSWYVINFSLSDVELWVVAGPASPFLHYEDYITLLP